MPKDLDATGADAGNNKQRFDRENLYNITRAFRGRYCETQAV
jgi:hypothetical protein